MKKWLAMALALALLVGGTGALAEYEEHISITATYVDRGSTEQDDMYHYFCDPFNMDIEMIPIAWSALNDTNNVMIMGGTMYDWMMITMDNYNTYLEYVDQGLLKPLPEGFEEKYPNIARAFAASGISDYLYVDGQAYGTPMPIYFNFSPREYALNMMVVFYRADWAQELGFEWDTSATLSEFEAYLKACVENDMAGNGQTLGLCAPDPTAIYMANFCQGWSDFTQNGEEYVWGPTLEGVTDGIRRVKEAYNNGLIDPDFYALDSFGAQNKFAAGLSAACYNTGTTANYQIVLDAALSSGIENPEQVIKPIMITDDAGVWHGDEVKNFWCVNVFRPDMDDATFERILALLDFLYTKEAQEVINMGMPGVDWELDEEGYYVSLLSEEYSNVRQKYPSGWFWRDTAVCLDEFDLVNPTYSKEVLDSINAMYDFRYAQAEEYGYRALDNHVTYLDSEAMSNYSVEIWGEAVRIICDANIDMESVESEWDSFIEENRPIWEPVLEDLNAPQE